MTDAAGKKKIYVTDALGRVTASTQKWNSYINYVYNGTRSIVSCPSDFDTGRTRVEMSLYAARIAWPRTRPQIACALKCVRHRGRQLIGILFAGTVYISKGWGCTQGSVANARKGLDTIVETADTSVQCHLLKRIRSLFHTVVAYASGSVSASCTKAMRLWTPASFLSQRHWTRVSAPPSAAADMSLDAASMSSPRTHGPTAERDSCVRRRAQFPPYFSGSTSASYWRGGFRPCTR